MTPDHFMELVDQVLCGAGTVVEPGDDYRRPVLEVLRYYRRTLRLHAVPLLGRALGLTAVARQPADIAFGEAGYGDLLTRVAQAASDRFPPWKGLTIGLTCVLLTPEPVGPGDDAVLGQVLGRSLRRYRVVPFGLFRVNLSQEALAFALRSGPDQLFPEPVQLADALSEHLRRFVPLLEMNG